LLNCKKQQQSIPNVKGMPGMDAIALENLGVKVKAVGMGKVKTQSLQAGQDIIKNTTITLELL
jgi:cell division protein FtsI (penicillin-binding protein 3)